VLHFAFLDGAIGYDCVRCQARCCRGLGFALAPGELVPLVSRAPGVAPFLQLHATAVHAFDLTDGCWLLTADSRCSLELAHGRAAKPALCRLFPLRVGRSGEDVVVELQLGACPLEDARGLSAGPGRTVLRHEPLATELADAELLAFAVELRLAPGAPADLLGREAAARDRTAGWLDASRIEDALGGAADELTALTNEWRGYFGLVADESAALAAEVARPFLLAVPGLRMNALTAPGAPPWPRLERGLPARLAAAAFLAALSLRAGRAPSLRAIAELWQNTWLVREALARWHEPLRPSEGEPPESTPPELGRAFARVRASERPLGEALGDAAAGLAPSLRPLLLRLVSDRLL
jgi:hypothetical protein